MNAVGMHIYAGGFSVGIARHFKLSAHLEELSLGNETYKLNFPKVPFYGTKEEWPLESLYGKTDLLFCNPPCNSWSICSKGKEKDNWKADSRTDFSKTCFNTFLALEPTIYVWESVCRAFTEGRSLVNHFVQQANSKGYHVDVILINLADLGIAQQRKRFLFVASKVQINWKRPNIKRVTVEEALRGFKSTVVAHEKGTEKEQEFFKHVKPGQGFKGVWEKLNPPDKRQYRELKNNRRIIVGRPPFMMHRVKPDSQIGTITSVMGHMHWKYDRWLTAPEIALLMGFPKDYKFAGPRITWQTQIAKGVSPAIGDFIGQHAVAAIRRNAQVVAPGFSVHNFLREKDLFDV